MHDVRYWVGFNRVYGVGPTKVRALIDHFGDLEAAWNAGPSDLKEAGLDRRSIENLLNTRVKLDLDQEVDRVHKAGARIVIWDDPDYPPLLKNLPDAPPVLYLKGQMNTADREWTVAVVGTRRATAYGRQAAETLATDLVRNGITVVSGLARGIDACAHEAALKAGGRTLGVLACGIDQVYPPEHARLAARIVEQGALLTEAACGSPPEAGNFPARNRIISGLARGTVIIEAAEDSGSLITARYTIEQKRKLYAVPGNISSLVSKGPNSLIKQGAVLIESSADILKDLGVRNPAAGTGIMQTLPSLSPEEEAIFGCLSGEPKHIDKIMNESRTDAGRLSALLMSLELKGVARQLPGKYFLRDE